MDDRQRRELRAHLVRELARLQVELPASVPAICTFGACADDNEHASRLAEADVLVRLARRGVRRMAELQSALRRLDAADYGVCEACDEDIPLARLKATPATCLCVQCQQELESAAACAASTGTPARLSC